MKNVKIEKLRQNLREVNNFVKSQVNKKFAVPEIKLRNKYKHSAWYDLKKKAIYIYQWRNPRPHFYEYVLAHELFHHLQYIAKLDLKNKKIRKLVGSSLSGKECSNLSDGIYQGSAIMFGALYLSRNQNNKKYKIKKIIDFISEKQHRKIFNIKTEKFFAKKIKYSEDWNKYEPIFKKTKIGLFIPFALYVSNNFDSRKTINDMLNENRVYKVIESLSK
jgi:hypothetical protein